MSTATTSQTTVEPQQPRESSTAATERWSLWRRIALRFGVIYFTLFTLWIPVHFIGIPPVPQLYTQYQALRRMIVEWVGEGLLHVQVNTGIPNPGNGSKDTTFNYVELLCYIGVAILVTIVWSLLDRRRPNYARLETWFLWYLRFALGVTMIQYGSAKIFPSQFGLVSLTTLLEPFGEASPMHLLWTFMAASPIYSFFAGATEVLGGILLLIPRTATLGALVSLGATVNVLALNFGYDVPVKIGATNLTIIAVLLLLPNLRQLVDFFFLNRRAEPAPVRPLFRNPRWNRIVVALQLLFAIVLLGNGIYHSEQYVQEETQARKTTPFYGIWTVEEFTLGGQARPPLLTDASRWQRVIVDTGGMMVQPMTGPPSYFTMQVYRSKKTILLGNPEDPKRQTTLAYEDPQPDEVILRGQIDGQPMTATLRRVDESKFLLLNRGFHWVNESALNH